MAIGLINKGIISRQNYDISDGIAAVGTVAQTTNQYDSLANLDTTIFTRINLSNVGTGYAKCAISPDKSLIIFGGTISPFIHIRHWVENSKSYTVSSDPPFFDESITSIAFANNSSLFAIGTATKIRLFQARHTTSNFTYVFEEITTPAISGPITGLKFDSTGRKLYYSANASVGFGVLELWREDQDPYWGYTVTLLSSPLDTMQTEVLNFDISVDDNRLCIIRTGAAFTERVKIYYFDAESGLFQLQSITLPSTLTNVLTDCAYSDTGNLLAITSSASAFIRYYKIDYGANTYTNITTASDGPGISYAAKFSKGYLTVAGTSTPRLLTYKYRESAGFFSREAMPADQFESTVIDCDVDPFSEIFIGVGGDNQIGRAYSNNSMFGLSINYTESNLGNNTSTAYIDSSSDSRYMSLGVTSIALSSVEGVTIYKNDDFGWNKQVTFLAPGVSNYVHGGAAMADDDDYYFCVVGYYVAESGNQFTKAYILPKQSQDNGWQSLLLTNPTSTRPTTMDINKNQIIATSDTVRAALYQANFAAGNTITLLWQSGIGSFAKTSNPISRLSKDGRFYAISNRQLIGFSQSFLNLFELGADGTPTEINSAGVFLDNYYTVAAISFNGDRMAVLWERNGTASNPISYQTMVVYEITGSPGSYSVSEIYRSVFIKDAAAILGCSFNSLGHIICGVSAGSVNLSRLDGYIFMPYGKTYIRRQLRNSSITTFGSHQLASSAIGDYYFKYKITNSVAGNNVLDIVTLTDTTGKLDFKANNSMASLNSYTGQYGGYAASNGLAMTQSAHIRLSRYNRRPL